jgi:hypothetical protein
MIARISVATLCVAVILSGAGACGDDEQERCAMDDECADFAHRLGRCGPKEVWCSDKGQCTGGCRDLCVTADPRVTVCPERLVCSDTGATNPMPSSCTALPISCDSEADCPLFLPGDGSWECVEGICRFPGFTYASGR